MNRIIVSNDTHPLYHKLKDLEGFVELDGLKPQTVDLVYDFTALETSKKKNLLDLFSAPIISDLSLNAGESLFKEYPNLIAAVGTVFPSPNLKCEVYYESIEARTRLEDLLKELGLTTVEVSTPGIGFIFGRTIVQIINESWFSLQDDLASASAIDTAMLYGVNYPRGPLEWGEKAGLSNVVTLLEELYNKTNQDRYKVCPRLKEASL